MAVRFWSYSMKSSIARTIAHRLGGLVILHQRSRYRYRPGDVVVNWGATNVPPQYPVSLNHPDAIAVCCSKMRTFQALGSAGVPTCEWTTQPDLARQWFTQGSVVYARTRDSGARGIGINVISPEQPGTWDAQYVNASATGNIRFFTKRVANTREFRIYVVGGVVTSVLEKKRRLGTNPSEYVRNHGDWVFGQGLRGPIPQSLLDTSVKANTAIGLDFSGVDIVLSASGVPVVLEVNSAPGVDAPTSQTQFVTGLQNLIRDRFNVTAC